MDKEQTNRQGPGDLLSLGLDTTEVTKLGESGVRSRKDLAGILLTEGGEDMLSAIVASRSTPELRQMLTPEIEAIENSVGGDQISPMFFGVIEDLEEEEVDGD